MSKYLVYGFEEIALVLIVIFSVARKQPGSKSGKQSKRNWTVERDGKFYKLWSFNN